MKLPLRQLEETFSPLYLNPSFSSRHFRGVRQSLLSSSLPPRPFVFSFSFIRLPLGPLLFCLLFSLVRRARLARHPVTFVLLFMRCNSGSAISSLKLAWLPEPVPYLSRSLPPLRQLAASVLFYFNFSFIHFSALLGERSSRPSTLDTCTPGSGVYSHLLVRR